MGLPRLHVKDIPESGLSFVCEVGSDELGLSLNDGRFLRELSLSAEVTSAGRGIRVTGVLAGISLRQCVRCLKEYEAPVELPFSVQYRHEQEPRHQHPVPRTGAGFAEAAPQDELGDHMVGDDEDDDVYMYMGDRLELAEMLREQIILATPMQPLCNVDCLGLCPVCGQDRNEHPCGCPEEGWGTPFSVLREQRETAGGSS